MMTETRKQWEKENKVFYGINLLKSTDIDIITYLDTVKQNGGSVQGAIKEAIRSYLASSGNNIYPQKSDMQETSD
jgi:hypothetical protein